MRVAEGRGQMGQLVPTLDQGCWAEKQLVKSIYQVLFPAQIIYPAALR